jgi:hypothetical protein
MNQKRDCSDVDIHFPIWGPETGGCMVRCPPLKLRSFVRCKTLPKRRDCAQRNRRTGSRIEMPVFFSFYPAYITKIQTQRAEGYSVSIPLRMSSLRGDRMRAPGNTQPPHEGQPSRSASHAASASARPHPSFFQLELGQGRGVGTQAGLRSIWDAGDSDRT